MLLSALLLLVSTVINFVFYVFCKLFLNWLTFLISEEKDFNPYLDDAFLLMFLRARKFNVLASANMMKNYYLARVKYPSMFKNFTPKSCMKVLKSNIHYFLPYRSSDGCAILLSKFGEICAFIN